MVLFIGHIHFSEHLAILFSFKLTYGILRNCISAKSLLVIDSSFCLFINWCYNNWFIYICRAEGSTIRQLNKKLLYLKLLLKPPHSYEKYSWEIIIFLALSNMKHVLLIGSLWIILSVRGVQYINLSSQSMPSFREGSATLMLYLLYQHVSL